MFLKLYGVISKICEPGTFEKCIPVFINSSERGKPTKFYKLNDDGKIAETDLSQYGNPVFLPASRKKINDGKEYFIIYRSTQNATHMRFITYQLSYIAICSDEEANWMSSSISVGIKFPDKFVCILAPNISKDKLENMLK